MKAYQFTFLAALLASSLTLRAQSRVPDRGSSDELSSSYGEEYGVLAERNIFLRDRSKPAPPPTSRPTVARAPEQNYVLTGVVYEPLEAEAFAFFEDIGAGTILRVRAGEKVARGTIQGIDINAVAYERDGKETIVSVGDDLTGARASAGSSSTTTASSSGAGASTATSAPAIDPNNPNLTLEERMKLRRQQQLR